MNISSWRDEHIDRKKTYNCCLECTSPSTKQTTNQALGTPSWTICFAESCAFLRSVLFVALPLFADSNSNWRSRGKQVPSGGKQKRYGCTRLHQLKNKIASSFIFFFKNSTKRTRINGNIHLLFILITLESNHWQRRKFTVPWEPIIWKRKHTRTDFSF